MRNLIVILLLVTTLISCKDSNRYQITQRTHFLPDYKYNGAKVMLLLDKGSPSDTIRLRIETFIWDELKHSYIWNSEAPLNNVNTKKEYAKAKTIVNGLEKGNDFINTIND